MENDLIYRNYPARRIYTKFGFDFQQGRESQIREKMQQDLLTVLAGKMRKP